MEAGTLVLTVEACSLGPRQNLVGVRETVVPLVVAAARLMTRHAVSKHTVGPMVARSEYTAGGRLQEARFVFVPGEGGDAVTQLDAYWEYWFPTVWGRALTLPQVMVVTALRLVGVEVQL